VAIIGAGPAGMLLGHLLRLADIDVVVIERKDREHVLSRIRAGILESTTTDLMRRLGLGQRLDREGIVHEGLILSSRDQDTRLDLVELTGRTVTAYGQTEISRDLFDAASERGVEIVWNAEAVALHDLDGRPYVTWSDGTQTHRLDCDFIAGCDGSYGVSRQAIPKGVVQAFEQIYPFGWLGILSDVPPCSHEVIYSRHQRGFAIASMRSMTRSRYYVQVPLEDTVEAWPDERLWRELELRLGPQAAKTITRGPAIEKSIAPLRSYVQEPMRYGALFLAGDAAHIVPPIGAKGLNLAASDVIYLGDALTRFYRQGEKDGLDGYSAKALSRIWRTERFSWHLTRLMHQFPETSAFENRMHEAELDAIAKSPAMQAALAEHYVGLPL
jgi:p-hydroxybenzoate 3-monooxygenase